MTTKSAFITAMGGALLPFGQKITFTRSSGNILAATGHGLETGAGPFKCMTTSGADLPSGLVAAVRASTFMTGDTMIATDVLNVAGKAYTLIATPAADGDVNVDLGASDAEIIANLVNAINLGPGAGTAYDIDMSANPTVEAIQTNANIITVRAKTLDHTIGNAIAVSSPDATMTVDNATLENGASGTDYYVIKLDDNTFSLATSKANAVAGTAVALSDAGTGVHTLVSTVQTLADMMEDVVTNYLTATGARVQPAAFNIAKFWQTLIDGTVTDGPASAT